jgi:hypothetical protein
VPVTSADFYVIFNLDWFTTDCDTIAEPTKITSGNDWELALVKAKNRPQDHPRGVHHLSFKKTRNSEGLMMAYVKFNNPAHFRQWVLQRGQ